MFLMELETKSKNISGNECDYEKDYMKIKSPQYGYNYKICF